MPIVQSRPITPGQRFLQRNRTGLTLNDPVKSLTKSKHRAKGRNCYGRITSRRRGGGHKRLYRQIDFKRSKLEVPGKVERLEYDPNRSAHIALITYEDNEQRYILAPKGLELGTSIISSANAVGFDVGNAMPLHLIPPGTTVHAVELQPGKGAQLGRSAGVGLRIINSEGKNTTLKLPSGEIRLVNSNSRATIGSVGNASHEKQVIGKAGRNRWKGRRPRVRGVAMNPVDHPMGGGEGRTSGGGHPKSPWGQLSKGFPTRRKSKTTNNMIIVRRNGRKMKR
jgi:large subunit ribosomal protein L2